MLERKRQRHKPPNILKVVVVAMDDTRENTSKQQDSLFPRGSLAAFGGSAPCRSALLPSWNRSIPPLQMTFVKERKRGKGVDFE